MLRPRQTEALQAIKTNYLNGVSRQVVSACTGFGKSVCLSHIPETMIGTIDGQMLVLVHREELINQNINKLRQYNPHIIVDKEKANEIANPDADIIVASVQTLGRNNTKRIERFNWDTINIVVTDECHHATSNAYLNIYEKAGVLNKETKKLHVGFSATPNRSDGNTLAKIYDKIVFDYPIKKAIKEGWLVDVRGIKIETGQSIDSVKTKDGDLDANGLAAVIDNPERNQIVVKGWLEYGENRQTVGFTANILHAQNLAKMFQEYGVNAQAIWGDDLERKEKLVAFKNGEIKILLNCALLIEGIDIWQIACILLTAPTKSVVRYVQEIGRSTRLEEGCPNLLTLTNHGFKRDSIIIDFCDLSSRHSLTSLPTLFGLPAQLDLRGKSVLWAAEQLEEAQEKFAHIDFTSLKDISKLELFIKETDLFAVRSFPEVEKNSQLVWHPAVSGGYILMLPEKDSVKIEQDLLDKWTIRASIKSKKYRGDRDSMEEAFSAADKLIRETCPESLKLINREEDWRKLPATEGQIKLLRKLYKGKQLPNEMSRGFASSKISEAMAGKKGK